MLLPQFKKIRPEPIAATVYDYLKQSILDGELLPGARLFEAQIATQMGVSRSPVREAFRQLEADGLIEIQTNLGATVRKLTVTDVEEIYTARSLIEGYAASLAAKHARPEDVERLRAALRSALDAAQRADFKHTVAADFDLHRLIWALSGHTILQDILTRLEVQIRMFMAVQAPLFGSLIDSLQGHKEIIDAIQRGDAEEARSRMEQHINSAATLLFQRLIEQADEGRPQSAPEPAA